MEAPARGSPALTALVSGQLAGLRTDQQRGPPGARVCPVAWGRPALLGPAPERPLQERPRLAVLRGLPRVGPPRLCRPSGSQRRLLGGVLLCVNPKSRRRASSALLPVAVTAPAPAPVCLLAKFTQIPGALAPPLRPAVPTAVAETNVQGQRPRCAGRPHPRTPGLCPVSTSPPGLWPGTRPAKAQVGGFGHNPAVRLPPDGAAALSSADALGRVVDDDDLQSEDPAWERELVDKVRAMSSLEKSLLLETVQSCVREHSQVGPGRPQLRARASAGRRRLSPRQACRAPADASVWCPAAASLSSAEASPACTWARALWR
ncbi:hypothetical protein J0S82_019227 [Galemys pyrenaicus]|uniref:Uncharacterized protein n=1 Tax=Galemys pyrenaicus TaxID=202257 RepID=A0A8J6DPY3_GALPY|nr:hypothetical protein J0S82_019227 [Galemys pyrenaicus]